MKQEDVPVRIICMLLTVWYGGLAGVCRSETPFQSGNVRCLNWEHWGKACVVIGCGLSLTRRMHGSCEGLRSRRQRHDSSTRFGMVMACWFCHEASRYDDDTTPTPRS